ncbi:MAG: hypothetical protein RL708_2578 [Bacteroidota bacterium]|jgi:hypothetical protein
MPKILIYKFLSFFFYAGDINERGHVHIINSKSYANAAKIWFENGVEIFDIGNLSKTELNTALKVVKANEPYLLQQWNLFKKGKSTKIKTINKI